MYRLLHFESELELRLYMFCEGHWEQHRAAVRLVGGEKEVVRLLFTWSVKSGETILFWQLSVPLGLLLRLQLVD